MITCCVQISIVLLVGVPSSSTVGTASGSSADRGSGILDVVYCIQYTDYIITAYSLYI